jgi:tRNA threonylcarbamoyladenosine biosynthesis protein TsaE
MSFLATSANELQYAKMENVSLSFSVKNLAETEEIAQKLAKILRPRDLVALHGTLGAGKSSFCRAIVLALAPHETEVPSPTITLVQNYDTPHGPLAHLDLYRLKNPEELEEIGFSDLRQGIMLVEWPDRMGSYAPKNHITVTLTIPDGADSTARHITISAPQGRLADIGIT